MLGIPIGALSSGGKVAGLLDMGGFMSGFGNYGASSSVQPTPTSSVTNINLNVATLVGTDEQAVRDQLIPLLNQAMANA